MPPEVVQPANKNGTWELVRFALIAVLIVIPIRIFIAQPFVVSGASMSPTFSNGDYLIINEISYRFNDPERFDVIVFRYPNDTKKFFIKRIIGLPNEEIDLKDGIVTIKNKEHPQGFVLEQPYVKNQSNENKNYQTKDSEYFVLGDNRSGSSDSRAWGMLQKKLIIGYAFLQLLPIKHLDFSPGAYEQKE